MGYMTKDSICIGPRWLQVGRWRLPTKEFQDWAIPYPSLNEQASIATFLGHETAKIDVLIGEQEG
jgi:type I restriction enzyme S subunit